MSPSHLLFFFLLQERAGAGVERALAVEQGPGGGGDGALAETEGTHLPPHRADDKRPQGAGRRKEGAEV